MRWHIHQIADAILDAMIRKDPMSRVACEVCCTTGLVLVMGEVTTEVYADIQKIVRDTIRDIGYDRAKYGFDCDTCGVIVALDEQSPDIAQGVDRALEVREGGMSDEELDLRRPIYRQTSVYGHFGRPDLDLPWERLDKVDLLKNTIHPPINIYQKKSS